MHKVFPVSYDFISHCYVVASNTGDSSASTLMAKHQLQVLTLIIDSGHATADIRIHFGPCYIALAWTAYKTLFPTVPLLLHVYPLLWTNVFRAVA
jgi:hypothetical protein